MDEASVLRQWLKLSEIENTLKRVVREQDAKLDKLAYDKYPTLTETDIKMLVVNDKWMARLSTAVQGELERVSQTLTARVRELAERYTPPLWQLTEDLAERGTRVAEHLARSSVSWN